MLDHRSHRLTWLSLAQPGFGHHELIAEIDLILIKFKILTRGTVGVISMKRSYV